MATIDMNSNQLGTSHCQNHLLPGNRPAPSYGDVRAVDTTSSWTQEPLLYNVGNIAVPFDHFKSTLPTLDQKKYFGLEDNARRAPENNHSFNKGAEVDYDLPTTEPLDYIKREEASTGHLSPHNRQNSHGFTFDASDGLTDSMQSILGDGLGSKDRPAVLEKDRPDNSQEYRNLDSCDGNYDNVESVQNDEGQHYTPKDPTLLLSDSEGRVLMDSEQKPFSNKRHDLNVRIMAFTPAWKAVKNAAYRENPVYAEQVFGDTGFLIARSKQITLDVLCDMAYPIGCEIERRLQELPSSLKRGWFSGDDEGLRANVVGHCHNIFDHYYLPAKPPKQRGRPASPTQPPSKAKKRGRPASQIQPLPKKKRGRPPKVRAPHG